MIMPSESAGKYGQKKLVFLHILLCNYFCPYMGKYESQKKILNSGNTFQLTKIQLGIWGFLKTSKGT